MKCAICSGVLKEEVTKMELWVDGKLIVIEDVPAKVCENCGEKYFSAKVSKQIDVLLESTGEVKRKLEVPVFSLKALKATG
jgi:HTH-type transcriptional regulator / antitoxin MqsA